MNLSEACIVGALGSPRGTATFERAPLVVTSKGSDRLLVDSYVDDTVIGTTIREHEWYEQLGTWKAFRIHVRPLPRGAALWRTRTGFPGVVAATLQLRDRGALLDRPIPLRVAIGLLVHEPTANPLRDEWAAAADAVARKHATERRWEPMLRAALHARAVEREASPERVAMVSLAHLRLGDVEHATRCVELAERSLGVEFAQAVRAHLAKLEKAYPRRARRASKTKGAA